MCSRGSIPVVHRVSHWVSVMLALTPGQHDGRVVHLPLVTALISTVVTPGAILLASPSGGCCLPGAFSKHCLSSTR